MNIHIAGYEIVEKLYESNYTLICRGKWLANNQPVILKILKAEVATPDNLAHFRREFATTSRLTVTDVIKAYTLEPYQNTLAMTLEDIGGKSLDYWLTQHYISPSQCLSIAIKLSAILAGLHQQQIIHKDINPTHIVWNPDTTQLRLIDLGLANDISQQRIPLQHPAALLGTLAYMSPEQTGRVNRIVDYRTDFYSLGVTLYQMLTRKQPFEADDALGLVHCHIAQTAVPPAEVDSGVPVIISEIVMKLMAKMAEDRYQSVKGLKTDLERCFDELTATGNISHFVLGQMDVSENFPLSQKLYGRTNEITHLLATFDRTCAGNRELLLISGSAGVGKTALVHEIHKPITTKRGNFIEGKFDQWEQNLPYSGWIQAFGSLVRYLLMETESQLAVWRQGILAAVGNNGKVLTDVITDLKLVIGPQPEVLTLPPLEAQNRFRHVFQNLVKFFATAKHPLTIFLDDLQWADPASIQLMETLFDVPGLTHFLLIGAYRDAEVDPVHPLAQLLERREKAGLTAILVRLHPIEIADVQQLLAELLHADAERVADLAQLVHTRTGGNPYFITEFLKTLHQTKLITFTEGWQWNTDQIQQLGISDDVVDLMIGKLRQLPVQTWQVLQVAACLGVESDRRQLAHVCGKSEDELLQDLRLAIHEGLVLVSENTIRFAHDKVSEAAYALISEPERLNLHYQIGTTLLALDQVEGSEKEVFRIAEQLNIVQHQLTAAEKAQLFRINLRAGQQAKASAAYDTACRFLHQAANLLPVDAWETAYTTTLALYNDWAEAEYIALNLITAETLFDIILCHARTLPDKIRIYRLQIDHHETAMRFQNAVAIILKVLNEAGILFPPPEQINQAATQTQMARFLQNLERHPIAEMINLPEANSPYREAIEILGEAHTLFWLAYPNSVLYGVLEGINLTLEHGARPASALSLSMAGLLLCSASGQIELGYAVGEMSLKMLDHFGDPFLQSEIEMHFYNWIAYWRNPLHYGNEQLLQAYYKAVNTGNNLQAAYCLNNYLARGTFVGDSLSAIKDQYVQFATPFYGLKQPNTYVTFEAFRQLVYNLLKSGNNPYRLDGEFFNEAQTLAQMWEVKFYAGIGVVAFCKLYLQCFMGDFQGALQFLTSPGIEDCLKALVGLYGLFLGMLFSALTYLQNYLMASEADQTQYLAKAETIQSQLKTCTDQYPPNFLALYCLVSAEIARVKGEYWRAAEDYNQAISSAQAQDFRHLLALAHELAGKFLLECNQENYAQVHIMSAYDAYQRWGAQAKVTLLEAQYSQWLAPKVKTAPDHRKPNLLDIQTIMKASHAITSEIEQERLLAQIMAIVIENAGAERGYFVENRNGQLVIQARGEIGSKQTETLQGTPIEDSNQLPLSILYYVAHSQMTVVLPDAFQDATYAADPYLSEHRTRSLLCLPVIHQMRLSGLLYLENNLVTDVFTPDRVEFLKALASQMAISLENANLYAHLEQANTRLMAEITERKLAEMAEHDQRILAEALQDTAAALTGTLDISQVMSRILENVGRVVRHDHANIMLIDGDIARFAYWNNYPADYDAFFKTSYLPLTLPNLHEIITGNAPVMVADTWTYPGWVNARETMTTRSYIGMPIRSRNQIIGFLNLDSEQTGFFATAQLETLRAFADQVAIALENAQLYDEIRRYADQLEQQVRERTNELDQERARLRAILEGITEAVIYIDAATGRTQFVNKAFTDLTGRLPEEVLDQPLQVHQQVFDTPKEYAQLSSTIDRVISQDRVWRGILTGHRKDGIPLELELTASRVPASGERQAGVVVLARDIGMERALQARKDRFITNASHELRTPITSLKLRLYMAQRQPEKWREHLANIESTTDYIVTLVESLLDVSRFERGVITLQRETIALQAVLTSAIAECQPQAENKQIQLSSQLQEMPLYIYGDSTRIRQVADNLIINAINYTSEGGQVQVEVFAGQNQDAIFRVRDNGIGIAAEDITQLFEPFYRVIGTRTQGTGLGLAITKEIVNLHGGKIVVESEINKGSIFSVSLPLVLTVQQ